MTNVQVSLADRWLRVRFPEGHSADFHYRWLRHACDLDRHPTTGERTVCSSEIPDGVRPTDAVVEGADLIVAWEHDGRRSRYALGWLEEHAYARGRDVASTTRPPSDVGTIEVVAAGPLKKRAARALELVKQRGAAVVRARPSERTSPESATEDVIEAFAELGLSVVGTHFGRIEDLRTDNTTNQNTDQLGYTDAAVDLHTDQPFLDEPPRYQLLHSIRVADSGGENAIVDASAAAAFLKSEDLAAYETLTSTPVRFHRKQKSFERVVVSPVLSEGPPFQVRFSYFTMAPHNLPFETMEAFYRAYDAFSRLVRDPRNQYRFLLQPGDFLLYDNHRMLHARTSFRGARWMRGVYFDAR